MSHYEVQKWARYRAKKGGMNLALRFERAIAMLAAMYANSHTNNGSYKIFDFTPYEDEAEISLEEAMEKWR